ncbi:uncharacterized protein LOC133530250 [Cydia pomonella]|uniref:uncharacterized protein LOC133530250 n=1 Tax=Cydia pomonella TaxID=82600 RepID=UPI002ADE4E85|nr:uncharacterized protein LOC133530250 [Cydia pomonella]
MTCVIKGCKSHAGRNENTQEPVTFHRHSQICSKLFTSDSFLANENIKWRRLKAGVLLTLHLTDTLC